MIREHGWQSKTMVLLDAAAQEVADQFCQSHSDLSKAEQVYCNTLAVWAVHQYLQEQGLATDLNAGHGWDPVMQVCMDVADLVVPDCGRLECRPVFAGELQVEVPLDVMEDRVGYVMVGLDEVLEQATLLGFMPEATTQTVAIANLSPIDNLLEHLDNIKQAQGAFGQATESASEPLPTKLTAWLRRAVGSVQDFGISETVDQVWKQGWLTVEELLGSSAPALAPSYRTDTREGHALEEGALVKVTRGKVLPFETTIAEGPIALLVEIMPKVAEELNIWVKLCPQNGDRLPSDLRFMVLDEGGTEILSALSRSTPTIELNFCGEVGDRFDVKVELGDYSITEPFVV
ncbi:MAG: DUF1822 family protein [Cyanobacteria bacterium P01_F01_bin.150]